MRDIKSLIDELVDRHACRLLSAIAPAPADIDTFIPPAALGAAGALLRANGFTLTSRNPFQQVYRRFEAGGVLYVVDLVADFNLYAQETPLFMLSPRGSVTIGHDPSLHRALKYLCFGRVDQRAAVAAAQKDLAAFFADPSHFIWVDPRLIAASGDADRLFAAMRLRLGVPLARLRVWMRGYVVRRWARLGHGRAVAFLGPDGSGKSFIIEKLRHIGATRSVYLGDWFFVLQPFYNLLLRVPSPWNRFVHLFYLIENYLRWLCVLAQRWRGRIVLIDRFPGTNRSLSHDGALWRLNRMIFRLFPKPDLLVLLLADPAVIHARKPELTVDQIARLQTQLRRMIAGTRHIELETTDLDAALNQLLAALHDGRGEE